MAARLAAVGSVVPWLPVVLGNIVPSVKMTKNLGEVSPMVAEFVCRMAHIPNSLMKGAASKGVKTVLRARAFVCNLLLRCQAAGFAELLSRLSSFKDSASLSASGDHLTQRIAVLGICHAWDESMQMLRDPPSQLGARAPRQQVARDVLVQTSMVHAICVEESRGGRQVHSRAETFLVPILELSKKDAASLLSGLSKGSALPFNNAAHMHAIAQQVSACVLTLWSDAASSNRRALKHISALSEDWPKNILVDCSELCVLHQLHRVRIALVEAHSSVSLAYCLSKLARAGSIMNVVSDYICVYVDKHCVRRVGKPPQDAKDKSRRLMDLLFKLDAAHHMVQRGSKTKKTQLLRDIEGLLAMDNGNLRDGLTHHCWCDERAGPCCKDASETKARMKVVYLNFFVAHGLPVGTLSRWTHIGIIYTMLVSGFVFHDLFRKALEQGLRQDEDASERLREVDPAAIGAGDADRQHEHHARVQKVRMWLSNPATKFQVSVLCLVMQNFDALTYFLMGGEREGDGDARAPRRPGTLPRCEEPIPLPQVVARVHRMQAGFANLLSSWGEAGTPAYTLLESMGFGQGDVGDEGALLFVRRHCVGFSAGIYKRLEVRLRSLPLRLAILLNQDLAVEQRAAVASEFLSSRPCCVGPFGARVQKMFDTVESLLSPTAGATIAVWLRSLLWTTYGCEREHGSVRRLCHSAGQGRNFTLIARERLMESVRTIHMEKTKVDPIRALPAQEPGAQQHPGVQAPVALSDDPLRPHLCDMPAGSTWCDAPRVHLAPARHYAGGQFQVVADAGASAASATTDLPTQFGPVDRAPGVKSLGPPAKRVKVSGGSAYQLFQNERLKSAKELALPKDLTTRGTLTPTALAAVMERISREWKHLSAEERALFQARYEDRLQKRRAQAAQPDQGPSAISDTQTECAESHWGNGSRACSIHPGLVQKALQTCKMPKDAEVFDRSEFVVPPPPPPNGLRASGARCAT